MELGLNVKKKKAIRI